MVITKQMWADLNAKIDGLGKTPTTRAEMKEFSESVTKCGTKEWLGGYTAKALIQIREAATRGESSTLLYQPCTDEYFTTESWIESIKIGLKRLGYSVEVTQTTKFYDYSTPEFCYDRSGTKVEVSW